MGWYPDAPSRVIYLVANPSIFRDYLRDHRTVPPALRHVLRSASLAVKVSSVRSATRG